MVSIFPHDFPNADQTVVHKVSDGDRLVRRWHDWRQYSAGDTGPTGHFVCLDCAQVVAEFSEAAPCTAKLVPQSWIRRGHEG